jgi:hypothetical protein
MDRRFERRALVMRDQPWPNRRPRVGHQPRAELRVEFDPYGGSDGRDVVLTPERLDGAGAVLVDRHQVAGAVGACRGRGAERARVAVGDAAPPDDACLVRSRCCLLGDPVARGVRLRELEVGADELVERGVRFGERLLRFAAVA